MGEDVVGTASGAALWRSFAIRTAEKIEHYLQMGIKRGGVFSKEGKQCSMFTH